MRSLYELVVSVQSPEDIDDPSHCEIAVEPAVRSENLSDFFPVDEPEESLVEALREAGRHHAGVLGRLLAGLLPWIDLARHEHGCGRGALGHVFEDSAPSWFEACWAAHGGIVEPGLEDGAQPALWLYVPDSKRAEWLTRVKETLERIAADAERTSL